MVGPLHPSPLKISFVLETCNLKRTFVVLQVLAVVWGRDRDLKHSFWVGGLWEDAAHVHELICLCVNQVVNLMGWNLYPNWSFNYIWLG